MSQIIQNFGNGKANAFKQICNNENITLDDNEKIITNDKVLHDFF